MAGGFSDREHELANVCLVDACAVAATPSDLCPQWLESWTRFCTIRSALEMQQSRISLLASAYECTPCPHRDHTPLAPLVLEVLCDKPERFGRCLDVLRRAAVVLIGIEHYSPRVLLISSELVELQSKQRTVPHWTFSTFYIARCSGIWTWASRAVEADVAQASRFLLSS